TRVYSLNTFGNVIHAGTQEAAGDIEIDQLRRRLVETEAAMERIVVQMGNISRSVMHSSSPQQELKSLEMCTLLCSDCVSSFTFPVVHTYSLRDLRHFAFSYIPMLLYNHI
ncbi:hypothetical protein E2986_10596, partial [Frieseomelitta varia]